MARPAIYALELYRGDSYAWRWALWIDEDFAQPEDLTGVTAKAEIRNAPGGATIINMPCVVTQPNIIDMTLPATAWTSIGVKLTAWDLQLTYPDGEVFTAVAGPVTVTPDVTDSTVVGRRR